MSIRRKRRQRGKRKERMIEALKAWKRLSHCESRSASQDYASVILPIIRNLVPAQMARDIVGVQPMTLPVSMIDNATSGIEPTFKYRYVYGNRTKKEISEQRKKERAETKRKRSYVAKAKRAKRRSYKEKCMG